MAGHYWPELASRLIEGARFERKKAMLRAATIVKEGIVKTCQCGCTKKLDEIVRRLRNVR